MRSAVSVWPLMITRSEPVFRTAGGASSSFSSPPSESESAGLVAAPVSSVGAELDGGIDWDAVIAMLGDVALCSPHWAPAKNAATAMRTATRTFVQSDLPCIGVILRKREGISALQWSARLL